MEGSIGIAECDSYLAQYRSCAEANVPSHQMGAVISGLERRKSQWVKLATSGAKKEALRRLCAEAIDTAESELSDWSCAWVETHCGNGVIEIGEGCDDGGRENGDGCDSGCFEEGSGSGGSSSGGSGSGGAGTGGSPSTMSCTSGNSTELGVPGNTVQVANTACLKVESGYPGWWGVRNVKLANESGGNLPVPFDWQNSCASTAGSAIFTSDWQNITFGPTNANCATFIQLKGNGAATIRIKYHAP